MARFVCAFIPQFPAQTLVRLRPDLRERPVAVLEGDRPFEHLCSFNQLALQAGAQLGMSRPEAEALPLSLLSRSCAEELAARSALLSCLSTFCPSLEEFSGSTDCIFVLDLQGTNRLHGSVAAAMLRIRTAILALGLTPRLTSSANVHAALCAARSGHRALLHMPSGVEASTLAPLPLHILNLSDEQARTLSQWGLKTLGDLAALPEVDLISRLGQPGKRLRQLARGEATHYFQPISAPFTLEEFVEFDNPVETLEALLFTLNSMLAQLIARATSHALALASVTVTCTLEGALPHIRSLRPALPSVDRTIFLKLLHLDLEAHPPAASVLALRLTADHGHTSKVQLGLFSPQLPEPMRLEVTLARLAAVVGEDRVGRPALKDTHQTDAFRMLKFTIEPSKHPSAPSIRRSSPALRRLRPCVPIRVELRHGRINALWREQQRLEIQRLYGPWRFSGEWWTSLCWAVERWDFAAQSDNTLLLGVLLRNQIDRSWWLESLYD